MPLVSIVQDDKELSSAYGKEKLPKVVCRDAKTCAKDYIMGRKSLIGVDRNS